MLDREAPTIPFLPDALEQETAPSYPRRIIRSAIKDRTNSSADFGDEPKPTSRSISVHKFHIQ